MELLKKVARKTIEDYILHSDTIEAVKESHKLESETKKLIESIQHFIKCAQCVLENHTHNKVVNRFEEVQGRIKGEI
jgi:DNA-binding FrmR family transcriptional regulator